MFRRVWVECSRVNEVTTQRYLVFGEFGRVQAFRSGVLAFHFLDGCLQTIFDAELVLLEASQLLLATLMLDGVL